jgi:transposase
MHARGHGSDGRVLEAGLAHPRWAFCILAHGLIRASFVLQTPIQELRELTRTHKQLTREIVQHVQRIQAVLEEANVKLSSVITDILGPSGRRILRAIIAGETTHPGECRACEGRARPQERR